MTGLVLLVALLALVLVVWVLRRNARDREAYERELEDELRKDRDRPD